VSLTPSQRTLRARIAAFELHTAGGTTTVAARAAFRGSFEVQVDPNGVLTDAERQRRAEYARRAHMTRLALASSRARSAGRQQIAAVGTTPTAAMEDLDDASTSPTPLAV